MGLTDERSYRALLTDIGGVLLQNHWQQVAGDLARTVPIPREELARILLRLCPPFDLGDDSFEAFYQKVTASLGTPVPLDTFRAAALDSGLQLISANVELLQRLRASSGVRIVAVSNMAQVVRDAIEAKFRLSQVFDAEALSSRYHALKPGSTIYHAAVGLAGCAADECVFVDDSEVNVRGAAELGIRGVQVSGEPQEFRRVLEGLFHRPTVS